jgi:hypothetical protein
MDQPLDVVPYALLEIEDYLFRCHYHWVLTEEPTTFKVNGVVAEKHDLERRYWLFDAYDKKDKRQWFVVVGTGKSPFDPSKKMKRWMYGCTNDDDISPHEFLEQAYLEQLVHDARYLSLM